ncbi:hypothetical protein ODJ79_03005 [Actinoplanes sp. KI2]|uniref:hypothetical protein n=1 Tax=Actinoplanes sp. KI2 TaxID=2983315 RepID=UPI0021D5E838|nr:hypothetical protein [Actinoplanes sp. KI2]MCU7722674.1 hypothetical protein [Actinoplanes sp. KI2]
MTFVRPKAAVLGLAVLSLLLAGCGPTDQPTRPVVDSVTTTPAADATTEATPATESTGAPAKTAAAIPKATPTTHKPSPKPTTHKPSPKPSPKPTTKPPSGQMGVHPGAFCSPEGAIGYTSKGTRMRCTLKAGEDRARWRAA